MSACGESPALTAKVHAYNKGRCTGSAKLRKISIGAVLDGIFVQLQPVPFRVRPVGSGDWRLAELR